jgi:glucokinase
MDVGGSHVSAARFARNSGESLRLISRTRLALDSKADAQQILSVLLEAAASVVGNESRLRVAMPGPFDYDRGIGMFEGVGKFDALRGFDLGTAMSGALHISRNQIEFIKDSDAYAYGEAHNGAAKGYESFVCLTLGTGIGSAFVRSSRAIASGPDVPPGGDVFRLSLAGQPLESFSAPRSIEAAYQAQSGEPAKLPEICDRARAGDVIANSVLHRAMDVLGRVVGPWVRRFGAQSIVIGGSVAASADVLFPFLEHRLSNDSTLPVDGVRRAVHDDLAALTGAAATIPYAGD